MLENYNLVSVPGQISRPNPILFDGIDFDNLETPLLKPKNENQLTLDVQEVYTEEFSEDPTITIQGAWHPFYKKISLVVNAAPPPPNPQELQRLQLEFQKASAMYKKQIANYEVASVLALRKYIFIKKQRRIRAKVETRLKNILYMSGRSLVCSATMTLAGPAAIGWCFSSGFINVTINAAGKPVFGYGATVFLGTLESFLRLPPEHIGKLRKFLVELAELAKTSGKPMNELFTRAFSGKNPFTDSIQVADLVSARTIGSDTETVVGDFQAKIYEMMQYMVFAKVPLPSSTQTNMFLSSLAGTQSPQLANVNTIPEKLDLILGGILPHLWPGMKKIYTKTVPGWNDKSTFEKAADMAIDQLTPGWTRTGLKVALNMSHAFGNVKGYMDYAREFAYLYDDCQFEINNIKAVLFDERYEKEGFIQEHMGMNIDMLLQNSAFRTLFKGMLGVDSLEGNFWSMALYFKELTPASIVGYMTDVTYSSLAGTIGTAFKKSVVNGVWPTPPPDADELDEKLERERLIKEEFDKEMNEYSLKAVKQGKRGDSLTNALTTYYRNNAPPELYKGENLEAIDSVWRSGTQTLRNLNVSSQVKALFATTMATSLFMTVVKVLSFDPNSSHSWDMFSMFTKPFLDFFADIALLNIKWKANNILREFHLKLAKLYQEVYTKLVRERISLFLEPYMEIKNTKMLKLREYLEEHIYLSTYVHFCLKSVVDLALNTLAGIPTESLDRLIQGQLRNILPSGLTEYEAQYSPWDSSYLMGKLNEAFLNTSSVADFASISAYFGIKSTNPTATAFNMRNRLWNREGIVTFERKAEDLGEAVGDGISMQESQTIGGNILGAFRNFHLGLAYIMYNYFPTDTRYITEAFGFKLDTNAMLYVNDKKLIVQREKYRFAALLAMQFFESNPTTFTCDKVMLKGLHGQLRMGKYFQYDNALCNDVEVIFNAIQSSSATTPEGREQVVKEHEQVALFDFFVKHRGVSTPGVGQAAPYSKYFKMNGKYYKVVPSTSYTPNNIVPELGMLGFVITEESTIPDNTIFQYALTPGDVLYDVGKSEFPSFFKSTADLLTMNTHVTFLTLEEENGKFKLKTGSQSVAEFATMIALRNVYGRLISMSDSASDDDDKDFLKFLAESSMDFNIAVINGDTAQRDIEEEEKKLSALLDKDAALQAQYTNWLQKGGVLNTKVWKVHRDLRDALERKQMSDFAISEYIRNNKPMSDAISSALTRNKARFEASLAEFNTNDMELLLENLIQNLESSGDDGKDDQRFAKFRKWYNENADRIKTIGENTDENGRKFLDEIALMFADFDTFKEQMKELQKNLLKDKASLRKLREDFAQNAAQAVQLDFSFHQLFVQKFAELKHRFQIHGEMIHSGVESQGKKANLVDAWKDAIETLEVNNVVSSLNKYAKNRNDAVTAYNAAKTSQDSQKESVLKEITALTGNPFFESQIRSGFNCNSIPGVPIAQCTRYNELLVLQITRPDMSLDIIAASANLVKGSPQLQALFARYEAEAAGFLQLARSLGTLAEGEKAKTTGVLVESAKNGADAKRLLNGYKSFTLENLVITDTNAVINVEAPTGSTKSISTLEGELAANTKSRQQKEGEVNTIRTDYNSLFEKYSLGEIGIEQLHLKGAELARAESDLQDLQASHTRLLTELHAAEDERDRSVGNELITKQTGLQQRREDLQRRQGLLAKDIETYNKLLNEINGLGSADVLTPDNKAKIRQLTALYAKIVGTNQLLRSDSEVFERDAASLNRDVDSYTLRRNQASFRFLEDINTRVNRSELQDTIAFYTNALAFMPETDPLYATLTEHLQTLTGLSSILNTNFASFLALYGADNFAALRSLTTLPLLKNSFAFWSTYATNPDRLELVQAITRNASSTIATALTTLEARVAGTAVRLPPEQQALFDALKNQAGSDPYLRSQLDRIQTFIDATDTSATSLLSRASRATTPKLGASIYELNLFLTHSIAFQRETGNFMTSIVVDASRLDGVVDLLNTLNEYILNKPKELDKLRGELITAMATHPEFKEPLQALRSTLERAAAVFSKGGYDTTDFEAYMRNELQKVLAGKGLTPFKTPIFSAATRGEAQYLLFSHLWGDLRYEQAFRYFLDNDAVMDTLVSIKNPAELIPHIELGAALERTAIENFQAALRGFPNITKSQFEDALNKLKPGAGGLYNRLLPLLNDVELTSNPLMSRLYTDHLRQVRDMSLSLDFTKLTTLKYNLERLKELNVLLLPSTNVVSQMDNLKNLLTYFKLNGYSDQFRRFQPFQANFNTVFQRLLTGLRADNPLGTLPDEITTAFSLIAAEQAAAARRAAAAAEQAAAAEKAADPLPLFVGLQPPAVTVDRVAAKPPTAPLADAPVVAPLADGGIARLERVLAGNTLIRELNAAKDTDSMQNALRSFVNSRPFKEDEKRFFGKLKYDKNIIKFLKQYATDYKEDNRNAILRLMNAYERYQLEIGKGKPPTIAFTIATTTYNDYAGNNLSVAPPLAPPPIQNEYSKEDRAFLRRGLEIFKNQQPDDTNNVSILHAMKINDPTPISNEEFAAYLKELDIRPDELLILGKFVDQEIAHWRTKLELIKGSNVGTLPAVIIEYINNYNGDKGKRDAINDAFDDFLGQLDKRVEVDTKLYRQAQARPTASTNTTSVPFQSPAADLATRLRNLEAYQALQSQLSTASDMIDKFGVDKGKFAARLTTLREQLDLAMNNPYVLDSTLSDTIANFIGAANAYFRVQAVAEIIDDTKYNLKFPTRFTTFGKTIITTKQFILDYIEQASPTEPLSPTITESLIPGLEQDPIYLGLLQYSQWQKALSQIEHTLEISDKRENDAAKQKLANLRERAEAYVYNIILGYSFLSLERKATQLSFDINTFYGEIEPDSEAVLLATIDNLALYISGVESTIADHEARLADALDTENKITGISIDTLKEQDKFKNLQKNIEKVKEKLKELQALLLRLVESTDLKTGLQLRNVNAEQQALRNEISVDVDHNEEDLLAFELWKPFWDQTNAVLAPLFENMFLDDETLKKMRSEDSPLKIFGINIGIPTLDGYTDYILSFVGARKGYERILNLDWMKPRSALTNPSLTKEQFIEKVKGELGRKHKILDVNEADRIARYFADRVFSTTTRTDSLTLYPYGELDQNSATNIHDNILRVLKEFANQKADTALGNRHYRASYLARVAAHIPVSVAFGFSLGDKISTFLFPKIQKKIVENFLWNLRNRQVLGALHGTVTKTVLRRSLLQKFGAGIAGHISIFALYEGVVLTKDAFKRRDAWAAAQGGTLLALGAVGVYLNPYGAALVISGHAISAVTFLLMDPQRAIVYYSNLFNTRAFKDRTKEWEIALYKNYYNTPSFKSRFKKVMGKELDSYKTFEEYQAAIQEYFNKEFEKLTTPIATPGPPKKLNFLEGLLVGLDDGLKGWKGPVSGGAHPVFKDIDANPNEALAVYCALCSVEQNNYKGEDEMNKHKFDFDELSMYLGSFVFNSYTVFYHQGTYPITS